MAKKIYDVKPPRVARKTENDIKEFLGTEKKRKHTVTRVVRHKKESQSSFKFLPIAILVVVILASVFLYFRLQKANIDIWPKVETLSFTQTIVADKSANEVSLSSNIIPAKYIEVEKTDSQEFSATGNATNEGKSTGTITIYNKYEPASSITLKAGTHLLSDSGKYFVTLEKVVVPKATKSGSKLTPGSVKVKVQATEGGEAYNIGPANFSVPKLSGTAFYYSIYAVSTEAMTGGFNSDVKKVTDDDISQAKDTLVKKASSEAIEELKNKLDKDYILLDDAVSYITTSAGTETKIGTVIEKFSYTATVKASGLAFKKSDLDKFAKDYLISQMTEDNTILDSSFKSEYALKTLDISDGKMTLDISFSSGVYGNINKNSLALLLTGKNSAQITEVINNNLGSSVSKVTVNFWPFWVTKSPKVQKAIKIDLKF
jgi:hypothetical protein